jgi:hypothetical protein
LTLVLIPGDRGQRLVMFEAVPPAFPLHHRAPEVPLVYLHLQLEPVRASLLRAPLLDAGVLGADELADIALQVGDLEALWRPVLPHDHASRWSSGCC